MQLKNSLDIESVIKIFKGALIAGGGVFAVYFLEGFAKLDMGDYSVLVAGLCAVLINSIKEYLKGD